MGIHRWPVNSPQKRPVKRQMFPFDDVIMILSELFHKCECEPLIRFWSAYFWRVCDKMSAHLLHNGIVLFTVPVTLNVARLWLVVSTLRISRTFVPVTWFILSFIHFKANHPIMPRGFVLVQGVPNVVVYNNNKWYEYDALIESFGIDDIILHRLLCTIYHGNEL